MQVGALSVLAALVVCGELIGLAGQLWSPTLLEPGWRPGFAVTQIATAATLGAPTPGWLAWRVEKGTRRTVMA